MSAVAFAAIACALSLGCEAQQPRTDERRARADTLRQSDSSKVLIVCLSRTNNTKAIADIIQEKVGGAMIALELQTPYPADYNAIVAQVARENEAGVLPPLRTRIDSIQHYEVVFLGFPTWGMQLPPPLKSFLRQYDLSGKTVIPFNTNAGYGEGSTFRKVNEMCRGCRVLEGFVTRGGVERDGQYVVITGARAEEARREVESWLGRLDLRLPARGRHEREWPVSVAVSVGGDLIRHLVQETRQIARAARVKPTARRISCTLCGRLESVWWG